MNHMIARVMKRGGNHPIVKEEPIRLQPVEGEKISSTCLINNLSFMFLQYNYYFSLGTTRRRNTHVKDETIG